LGLELVGAGLTVEDGQQILADLDVQVQPGEMLAVVGEVACGKTSLLSLFAGTHRPTVGSVRVGGIDAHRIQGSVLRENLGYVPQDPVILSVSLRENILLGRTVPDDVLERALEVSRLAQDLPALSNGLDTEVGERGLTLSGGQQQRVALARALVGMPRILLLDDATAALDADTEQAFWQQLETVLPDVTAVVVTHRVATMQRAGEIVVLEAGRVVQRGTHATLIEQAGAYRRIYGRSRARERIGVR
jgi:ABC-type multidrug transport system fused ATPase/permease subunit